MEKKKADMVASAGAFPENADMRTFFHKLWISAAVVLPLLGVLAAIVLSWNRYVFPSDLWLLLIFYVLTGLGVTLGYHRLLTHDSFKTYAPLRAFWVILGCMGFEGAPITWAATHIKHHAHSDEENDPHSPLEGFWHAHMGWLYSPSNFGDAKLYAPHLLQDPVILFVNRLAPLWPILSLLLPFLLGGWTGLIWGGLVRVFLVHHVTWSVNSVCHTFGRRAFETSDESHNEWIVGLLAFGEGWHNNHHAFPRNAFHGMRWHQFDLSGLLIRGMEAVGLAWDVQRVSPETAEAQKIRAEKSAPLLADLRTQLQEWIATADTELQRLLTERVAVTLQSAEKDLHRLQSFQKHASKRLAKIRHYVSNAAHLKRQQLAVYMKEVQQMAETAKTELQRQKSLLMMDTSVKATESVS